ncbi:MAG: glycosyltransferase family 2 protein [Paludibacteraceae bacterium]|nr:glycosyltransferase family 2 protein [Paludibacteraceae bacterium]
MICSVIILNWNGAEMLRRYLPSVVKSCQQGQTCIRHQTEIIVADNGSTDDSIALLKREFPSVRVIALERNYGFAEGYNRAITANGESEPEYTVLLNSDVEVTEGWLEPMLDYLDHHKDVAAVQPKIRSWKQRNRFEHAGAAGGFVNRLGYPYCRGRVLWHVEEDKGQYDTVAEVDWTSGACMCVRTTVYKECGGLDAAFFAHMEEIDLCWRMRNRGWRLVCLPQSVVYHLGGGALSYDNPRKTYLNHRNNLLMIYKNKQHPRGVLFVRFFLDYAAAAFYLLQGRWGACKAVFEARRDYHKMRKNYAVL